MKDEHSKWLLLGITSATGILSPCDLTRIYHRILLLFVLINNEYPNVNYKLTQFISQPVFALNILSALTDSQYAVPPSPSPYTRRRDRGVPLSRAHLRDSAPTRNGMFCHEYWMRSSFYDVIRAERVTGRPEGVVRNPCNRQRPMIHAPFGRIFHH